MIPFLLFLLAMISFFSNKKSLSLFLLAALISGGFWIIGMSTTLLGFSVQLSDFALLYVFSILLVQLFRGKIKPLPLQLKPINYFLIFLLISMLIDATVNGTPLGDIFRTTRLWFFMFFAYLLPFYSKKTILQAIKYILLVTFIELLLFLIEPIVGKEFFSYAGTIEALKTTNISRYALIPPFIFFFFVWVFSIKNLKPIYKTTLLSLIIIAVFITTTRSMVIGIALIFLISIVIAKKQNIIKKFTIVLALIITIVSISFYEPLSKRFVSGISDINSLQSGSSEVSGNMSFRLLLVAERLEYIMKTSQTALLGLGFISEKNYTGHQFSIGLLNEEGERINLDTGDIAWAIFTVRFGILGTLFYLFIYYRLAKHFWRYRGNIYAMIGFNYIILYLFLSTSGSMLSKGTFIFIPLLLYGLTKLDNNKTTKAVI